MKVAVAQDWPELKSVIRRTKETDNVHPMYRECEAQRRRKMGPLIFHKSSSQDRLIQELQGRLGIGPVKHPRKPPNDWLTDGVIVMSNPQRSRESPDPTHAPALAPVPSPASVPIPAPVPASAPWLAPPPEPAPEHSPAPAPVLAPVPTPDPTSPVPEPTLTLPLAVDKIMSQGRGPSPLGANQGNKLDSMLGSLQSDLNRLGVQTVAKGVCGACRKPIIGQVVTAMGCTWHPEHFVCKHCQEEIGSRNFFERDGQPYCEEDYHNLYSPRCHYCNGAILDKVVTALDKTWHPDHFFCAQCGTFFGPEVSHRSIVLRQSKFRRSGPSMLMKRSLASISTDRLLLQSVLTRFMVLKPRSTAAVDIGRT
ncbi:hypothetical protein SKAU_G00282300 [Synaphobranchus kaupii]|uniref:LIM zinc-binding domain-containing protein n=1 Tax=Synaphobranchus kaupii TaxID=118154 RepID=A0A9Q1EXI8_SYNKA|nr:hypothetical protein SKAU_G00282300 [Synaphobranchus kaupii]